MHSIIRLKRRLLVWLGDTSRLSGLQALSEAFAQRHPLFAFLRHVSLIRCDATLIGEAGFLHAARGLPQMSRLTLELPPAWDGICSRAYACEAGGELQPSDTDAAVVQALWCATNSAN